MLKKHLAILMSAIFIAIFTAVLMASESETESNNVKSAVNGDVESKIVKGLAKLGLKVESINPSAMAQVYEVFTSGGLFYTNDDASKFIRGNMFELNGSGLNNVTEKSLMQIRLNGMDSFKESMIVYPAANEKYQVTVFTDLSCGYCRKFHADIEDYNALGITVRYLAFPRAGINSKAFKALENIWCAEQPQQAMDMGKAGKTLPSNSCAQPIAEQFYFGRNIGVTGTPAMILEDGTMLAGYHQPKALAKILYQSQ
ncbi:bifunctional protein-disulfide isomerase/oxidoreductase DsbC [Thalassotalea aquiviva]|uniref:bifunctional protein-disulfide isomerase/oxidoreductase DsbC n=1 Tax=Thalassotalea aquiviva TaxID=3242415 RepID=UPI00352B5E3E